jgi:hypothetical protein
VTQPEAEPSGGGAVAAGTVVAGAGAVAPSVALAMSARRVQLAIRAATIRDTVRLWPLLDPVRLDETFPGWVTAMESMLTRYHVQSAVAAQRSYVTARTLALGEDARQFIPALPATPDPQWVRRALGYAGPGQLQKIANPPAERDDDGQMRALTTAPDRRIVERRIRDRALVVTTGVAQRIVISGGRDLVLVNGVLRDDKAVGWYRLTDGDPCSFCALLSSRGITYKSTTVDFKAHDLCACMPQPAYSRDEALPAKNVEWAQLYADTAKNAAPGKQMQAFRAAYEGRPVPEEYQRPKRRTAAR